MEHLFAVERDKNPRSLIFAVLRNQVTHAKERQYLMSTESGLGKILGIYREWTKERKYWCLT